MRFSFLAISLWVRLNFGYREGTLCYVFVSDSSLFLTLDLLRAKGSKELGFRLCLSILICWSAFGAIASVSVGFGRSETKTKEWDLGSTPTPPPSL